MISKDLVKQFENLVGADNVMKGNSDLLTYSYDGSVLDQVMPDLVVRPTNKDELGKIIKLSYQNDIPITVRGAGSNLCGGTIPNVNGIVILTNGMNKILEINEEDLYARVEPGVVTAKFAAEVAGKGLFYPPDPGSQKVSTIAGNIAENAGGLRGLKYGVTRDYVMGIEFFDIEGNLVRSGSKTVKCVTGLNLTDLMIASEGILGIIAEVTLKLVPPPEASKAMSVVYSDIADASKSVAEIIKNKVVPCTLELMDNFTIKTVEDFSKAGLDTEAAAMLLIEVDGHPGQVADEAAKVEEICRKCGAKNITVAKDAAEKEKVWEARRAALSALAQLSPTLVLEDATVPRSKIPAMIEGIQNIAKKYDIMIGTFGHAGDGNLHPTILTDKRNHEEWEKVEKAVEDIFDVALDLGGTLSGEHGIGMAKEPFMIKEVGQATLDYSRKLKRAIDPKYLLNPGKLIGGGK